MLGLVNSIFECDYTSLFATEAKPVRYMMRLDRAITSGAELGTIGNGGLYQNYFPEPGMVDNT
jgi:hypothetical protein